MADVYGVTTDDVAAMMPGLFKDGFSESTKPDDTTVASWVTAADAQAQLAVAAVAGVAPTPSDLASSLAKQFVLMWTAAQVMRALYAGNDPERVAAAANQYAVPAKELLAQLKALGAQAAGAAAVAPLRVRGVDISRVRDTLVEDGDLGPGASRSRRF